MGQLVRFTSRAIASCDRLAKWDALVWGRRAPFYTLAPKGEFEAEASFGCVGILQLWRIIASAHRLECAGGAAANRGGAHALLIVQREGTSTLTQGGRCLGLEPGSWVICNPDRAFNLATHGPAEQLVALVPRDRLVFEARFAALSASLFGDAGGSARMLPCYLAGLFNEISSVAEGEGGELADMAAQLIRLALHEARDGSPRISMRETLRLRVKDYVRRNLRDPELSIQSVAAAFGCTKRHLHKVFKDDDMTLSHYIWSQRLEACREALRNPQFAHQSITEIAFMWGFNHSAHFSKAFKDRFGAPPLVYRKGNRAPPVKLLPVGRPARGADQELRNAA